jgi:hypothetical protein
VEKGEFRVPGRTAARTRAAGLGYAAPDTYC